MMSNIKQHESFKLFQHLEEILKTTDIIKIIFKYEFTNIVIDDLTAVSINSLNPDFLEFKTNNKIRLININDLQEVEVVI